MEGIDKIKEKILEEANQQACSIIDKAEKEADEIIKNAEEKAAGKKSQEAEKARMEAENKKSRIIAAAHMETRKRKLKAKQEMIDEAFNKAVNKLSTMPEDQYIDILANMAVQAITTGTEEIILPDKDRNKFGKKLIDAVNKKLKGKGVAGKVSLSEESKNITSGFIIKSGNIEINNSFESLIRMERDNLEPEVVKILFPGVS
ncbi:MAG TPA: hypothetical protein GXX20_04085 [Clostridiaceae bacterium]|nr:hypothetical protein [Clostridiaceae bacterium]